jgi:BirA family biotin operon repressor/biotin-[acetyl-CoA-carboxylase] ligase
VGGRLASAARIEVFEALDSTSLEAKRRAHSGSRGPVWIVALEQTAGYGRRGSQWEQRIGDIAATFLFEERAPSDSVAQLAFVAALAVAETIAAFAAAPLSLKWPNDVLANGGKISGILLELIDAKPASLIALGIGVNIVSKPQGVQHPTARLLDFAAHAPTPADFVERLDACFGGWRKRWLAQGFAPIRSAWLERAAGLGKTIRVQLPQEIVEGTFVDLDQGGALVLDCAGERRLISAGSILPSNLAGPTCMR